MLPSFIGEHAIGEFVDWQWQFRYPIGSRPTRSAQTFFTLRDALPEEEELKFATYYQGGATNSVTDGSSGSALSIDTEWYDDNNLATLASNTIHVTDGGGFWLSGNIWYSAGGAFDGKINVNLIADGYTLFVPKVYAAADGISSDIIWIPPTFISFAAGNTIAVTVDNDLGETINIYVNEITLILLKEP